MLPVKAIGSRVSSEPVMRHADGAEIGSGYPQVAGAVFDDIVDAMVGDPFVRAPVAEWARRIAGPFTQAASGADPQTPGASAIQTVGQLVRRHFIPVDALHCPGVVVWIRDQPAQARVCSRPNPALAIHGDGVEHWRAV